MATREPGPLDRLLSRSEVNVDTGGTSQLGSTEALPLPHDEHAAMSQQWFFHVDLDEFLAAVEVARRPELAGLPVVVGGDGDPTKRGVVSTASYAARAFGVGSGMPLRLAVRKCPDAVFLPVDRDAYDEASTRVMTTLRELTWAESPVVLQVLGWDEAFLAASAAVPDPQALGDHVRATVLAETGLHCSVGIGDNKLRAKIATDLGKPRGTFRLTAENWFEVMGEKRTESLWGIGRKTSRKLAGLGLDTVRQLAESDVRVLAAELGPTMGPWYHRLGRGVDTSPVDATPYIPRGHGRETTFQEDLTDWVRVAEEVRTLARRVVLDIDADARLAVRVGLKIRLRPFITLTRSLTLPAPTNDAQALADAAVSLLDKLDERDRDRPVRLLGVRLEMTRPELTADAVEPP